LHPAKPQPRVPTGFHSRGDGQEGTGTIKIEPGARERALNPGGDAAAKPATGKQAKAKVSEDAAAKKNPKLY